MKKICTISAVCLVMLTSMVAKNTMHSPEGTSAKKSGTNSGLDNAMAVNYWIDSLYTTMHLNEAGLARSIFFTACKGYEYLLSQSTLFKQDILTICDYS